MCLALGNLDAWDVIEAGNESPNFLVHGSDGVDVEVPGTGGRFGDVLVLDALDELVSLIVGVRNPEDLDALERLNVTVGVVDQFRTVY